MWCVLTWHFSALHTKPSGALCLRVGACPFVCQCLRVHHVCIHVSIGDVELAHSPLSSPSSHTRITLYVISQSHRQERNRERVLSRKVHLVSWQHPNYKIVETPCIERIILNYSELKFKFHFVLALSNGQNCLGEISKGQGELKCLL